MRLDIFISKQKNITRSQAQDLLRKECVKVNWKTIKKNWFEISWDEEIIIKEIPAKPFSAIATEMPIDVIFEDENLLVLNKEQWKQVYPWDEWDMTWTLLSWLRFYFSKEWKIADSDKDLKVEKIWFVHRLDKDTSWCLMIAKNVKTLNFYQKQFESRNVDKFYLAAVFWNVKNKWKIVWPIWRSKSDRKKMAVIQDWKEATTLFEPLEFFEKENITLLKVQILTWRTHQIRVHLSSIWFPIIWDSTYWNEKINQKIAWKYWIKKQMLHCLEMSIDWKNLEWKKFRQKFFAEPRENFWKIFWEDFFEKNFS